MRILAVATTAMALAACSGNAESGNTSDAAAPRSEVTETAGAAACDVLSKDVVDKAFGQDMGKPITSTDTMCQYMQSGERLVDQSIANLMIKDTTLDALASGIEEQGGRMEPVTGIGDKAFFSRDFGLYVEHNGRSGIYTAYNKLGEGGFTPHRELITTIAKATVDRL